MKTFNQFIAEARVITRTPDKPLSDDDTVRVYHGTPDLETAYKAVTQGLTGDRRVPRRYSYENNNNPSGLFVTPDLDTAKEFGPYVLEFHTKVSDLEAPVWPGKGSFAVQGEMAPMFGDDDERSAAAQKQLERLSQSDIEHIRNSDSPDVAFWLMNVGERQALFVGDLNRNSIRAIWSSKDPKRVTSDYERMKPKEFISRLEDGSLKTRLNITLDDIQKEVKKSGYFVFEPREKATVDKFLDRMAKQRKFLNKDKILGALKNAVKTDNKQTLMNMVWSERQYLELVDDIRKRT